MQQLCHRTVESTKPDLVVLGSLQVMNNRFDVVENEKLLGVEGDGNKQETCDVVWRGCLRQNSRGKKLNSKITEKEWCSSLTTSLWIHCSTRRLSKGEK